MFAGGTSPAVQYQPQTSYISGNQPIVAANGNVANDPFTLKITPPAFAANQYPLKATILITIPDPVGGVTLPLGFSRTAALGYVTVVASPGSVATSTGAGGQLTAISGTGAATTGTAAITFTFTDPSQTASAIISVNVPTPASIGQFGYHITEGWQTATGVTDISSLGFTDPGADINMTVLAPLGVPIVPLITNWAPLDGASFVYDPPTKDESPFTISYDASVPLGGGPLTALFATIDGKEFDGTSLLPYLDGSLPAVLGALLKTGIGTLSGHASVLSPHLKDGGPHIIVINAQNTGGLASQTIHINIKTPPKFTSADNTAFTLGQAGSFTVAAAGYSTPSLNLTGGTLPAGITFDPATGALSGTPTSAAGSAVTLTFTATNDVRSVTQTFTLTINKATLTVTANNATKVYGAANPAFSVTYSGFLNGDGTSVISGNPAFTTSATAASAVGSYAITPGRGTLSSANYNFVFADGTLSVTKAVLAVAAASTSRAYGAANPGFTASISGFVNGDGASAVTGVATVASSAGPTSPVGTYSITASAGSLASANYSFVFVPGTLTVTKAALTVTANNATKNVGAANPAFTATITGFMNGETTAVVSGTPGFTTSATTSSPAGTYDIVPTLGSLTATNYAFTTFVKGTLTVAGKANQTISFSALPNKQVGDPTFALTATASSGLAVTYTSSNPAVATVSGNIVTIKAAGTTTITASQPGNDTFNPATPVSQNLTVSAAQTCPTTVMWLPPISLNKTQQDGSVIPIKFFLQQCCTSTSGNNHYDDDDDDDNHSGCDDDGWHDSYHSGHDYDYSGNSVSCHHGKNGRSTSNSSCRADCDHDARDDDGCVNLRDTSVIISIYEVGSSAAATQYIYGTGSPNPPDYVINGDYKYQLNFPTARGSHHYHIDVYRFPPGATSPKLVGSKELYVK